MSHLPCTWIDVTPMPHSKSTEKARVTRSTVPGLRNSVFARQHVSQYPALGCAKPIPETWHPTVDIQGRVY